jgi:hypothetical protein
LVVDGATIVAGTPGASWVVWHCWEHGRPLKGRRDWLMRFARCGLVVVAVAVGVFASARWTLQAQDRAARGQAKARADNSGARPSAPAVSVQDAMLRPFDLPFGEETSLEEVRQYLAKTLGGQVVLDRSALGRLELTPEDTVQLDLKGVRLKVGLKLLLDQVGLTFRVVPEENLLILTDPEGSDDPAARSLAELKTLHREVHELQDAVDDLRDLVEEELGIEPEPARRKPVFAGTRQSRHAGRAPKARPAHANSRAGG